MNHSHDIMAAIPHRPPMLLVDSILSRTESEIVCQKTFQAHEPFVQGHYPGNPIVPGIVLCEAGMQAGAILLARWAEPQARQLPVATRLDNVRFKRIVRPHDTVEISVQLNERLGPAFFLTAKVTLQGKLAVRFDFACALVEV